MGRLCKAFSLVELIVVVLFIGILAAITVPRIDFAIISKQKVDTVSQKIVTDLRRTRGLAISNAANNTSGYELKLTGSGPYTGYDIINLNDLAVVDSLKIDPDVACTSGDDEFKFGPMGNLESSEYQLQVVTQGRSFTITIIPATGMVKCVEN